VDRTTGGIGDPNYPIQVFFLAAGTADIGNDYYLYDANGFNVSTYWIVTIPANEPDTVVELHPINDAKIESDETVNISVGSGSSVGTYVEGDACGDGGCGCGCGGYWIDGGENFSADGTSPSATVTILDDDHWDAIIDVSDAEALEPCTWIPAEDRRAEFVVTREPDDPAQADMTYSAKVELALSGTAKPVGDFYVDDPRDYEILNSLGHTLFVTEESDGTVKVIVTIPVDEVSTTIYVQPHGDHVFEKVETVVASVVAAYSGVSNGSDPDYDCDIGAPSVAEARIIQAPEFLSEVEPSPMTAPIPINADGYHRLIGAASKVGAGTLGDSPIDAMAPTGRTFKYSIHAGNDEGLFQIDSTTGEITAAVDFTNPLQTTYHIQIKVYDSAEPQLYDLATVSIAVLDFKVMKVDYLENHSLVSDPNSQGQTTSYAAEGVAEWYDENLNGTAGDAAGERRYPVAYTRNDALKLSATIKVDVTGLPSGWGDDVMVRATGNHNGIKIPATEATVTGDLITITNVSADSNDKFHNKIDYLPSFELAWQVSLDRGASWIDVGTSSTPVYLTYKDPLRSPLYHTVVHVGSTNGKNATDHNNEQAVFDAIWGEFQSLEVHQVQWSDPSGEISNRRVLQYWGPNSVESGQTAKLLEVGDGPCEAWANFLMDVLAAQGINSVFVAVTPNLPATGMLVKNWHFEGPGIDNPVDASYRWLEAILDANGNVLNEGQGGQGITVWSTGSIDGQGPLAPTKQLFGDHAIVRFGDKYYDPSYGNPDPIEDENDWEEFALHGFSTRYAVTVNGVNYWLRYASKQVDDTKEVTFTEVP
jgi:hypothetical protein